MKRVIRVSLPILAIFLVVACGQSKEKQLAELRKQQDELQQQITTLEKEVNTANPVAVRTKMVALEAVKPSAFNHYIEVQGRLDGEESVEVFTEAPGVIEQLNIKAGDRVSKGQVLARLNDKALKEQLNSLESSYSLANQMFEKQQRLWDQKIGSEVQYLQIKTQKESLEGQIAALKQQISMYSIKSPINGTVEAVSVKIGQMASAQMSSFKVVNFSTIKVVSTISEAYAQKVNDGDTVRIIFPDINYEVTGKLTFVSKFINPTNRTFEVEIRLPQIDRNIKANMIAVLRINDYHNANAHTIAINSVSNDKTGSYVWVAKPQGDKLIAERVTVKTGSTYNGSIEILEGLSDGDKVITAGFLNLKVGDLVKI